MPKLRDFFSLRVTEMQRDADGAEESGEIIGGPDEPSPASPAHIAPPRRPSHEHGALSISMVYRAVSIHAIAVKQMPLTRWKEDVVNALRADERRPLGSFLRKPDPDRSRGRFLEESTVSLALAGNAYWLKHLDNQGRIRSVELLNPHRMRITREDGEKRYWYGGRTTPYGPERVQHLKLLSVPGSEYGLGPIQAARAEINGYIDQRDYSANWFHESSVPTGILKSDQVISPQAAKSAKGQWRESQGGTRDIAVLGNNLSYMPIYLNPKDAQFLESMQFNTTQIARLFGTPASLMLAALEGSSQTYANVEQDWLGFVRFSNMQYLIEIEEALSELLPVFEYARFDVEALLRSDTTTRYSAYESALRAGWMLPSEVRLRENLKPVAGIDNRPAPTATSPQEGNDDEQA